MIHRRGVLGVVGGLFAGGAGCLSGGGGEPPAKANADVIAGPAGRYTFEPAEIRVGVGDTVSWYFDSRGHNVSCRPGDARTVELPEDAEPFASYGPDESPGTLVPRGETYAHTFETAGTYVYVCVPHQANGMDGRVVVEG